MPGTRNRIHHHVAATSDDVKYISDITVLYVRQKNSAELGRNLKYWDIEETDNLLNPKCLCRHILSESEEIGMPKVASATTNRSRLPGRGGQRGWLSHSPPAFHSTQCKVYWQRDYLVMMECNLVYWTWTAQCRFVFYPNHMYYLLG